MAPRVIEVALDVRETSHMSAGMIAYVRALRRWLPEIAPDIRLRETGGGDNFDYAEQIALPLATRGARVVHYASPFIPLAAAFQRRTIVTVHDLIDLHYPQYGKRRVQPYFRYAVGPVVRRARAVITDDDATVADLERFLRVSPERVRVVPLGFDAPDPLPPPVRRERPYVLYVGNRRPHKDLATLVAAWSRLHMPVDLVLSGRGPLEAVGCTGGGSIVELGDLDDRELAAWYRGAAAYVHPALIEGFGLPMLEAMRLGAPVIASARAVPSVVAPYARIVAAGDVTAFAAAMQAVLTDRIAAVRDAERAQVAAARLTWAETARRTAAVYREVAQ